MGEKTDLKDHEQLTWVVERLPKVKDVDDLKEYIIENIENFHNDNEGFRADFTV